jgi:hypothetical protein
MDNNKVETLAQAKELSLIRWANILADFPNIITTYSRPDYEKYGSCSFCELFKTSKCQSTKTNEFSICPLKGNVCEPCYLYSSMLFWKICRKLQKGEQDEELRGMIIQMIQAIAAVKVEPPPPPEPVWEDVTEKCKLEWFRLGTKFTIHLNHEGNTCYFYAPTDIDRCTFGSDYKIEEEETYKEHKKFRILHKRQK